MLQQRSVNWKEIIVFSVIATLISAPFRLNLVDLQAILKLPKPFSIFLHVFRGIGPITAFFIMYYLLKSSVPRTNNFFGRNMWTSVVAIIPIPLGLTIVELPNNSGIQENYFGFLYGIMLVLYAICEEYGWRGYLQQAVSPLALPVQIFVIALIWYLWHLNFLVEGIPLSTHVVHFLALVAGSWGLIKITEMSHSILFASAVHLSFNIFSDVRGQLNERLIILAAAVFTWVVLLRILRRSEASRLAPGKI